MGSFNSAPKINNIDSQDDTTEVPNGLETAADLVNHCKLMRGENRPELLPRSFFKPSADQNKDITDGLRYLQLNSVSKGNSRLFLLFFSFFFNFNFYGMQFSSNKITFYYVFIFSLQFTKIIAKTFENSPMEYFVTVYVFSFITTILLHITSISF